MNSMTTIDPVESSRLAWPHGNTFKRKALIKLLEKSPVVVRCVKARTYVYFVASVKGFEVVRCSLHDNVRLALDNNTNLDDGWRQTMVRKARFGWGIDVRHKQICLFDRMTDG